MFAYCKNNPIIYQDTEGEAVETVFDIASLIISAVEVAANPTDLSAWVGLIGDAVDLIPFVTGVGESIRVLRTTGKIADGTDEVIDTYKNLRKINKGTGKEAHHILEKRFIDKSIKQNQMLSVTLSKKAHQNYTNAWRVLGYGKKHEWDDIIKTGAQIYSDNPKLMAAFLLTLQNMK